MNVLYANEYVDECSNKSDKIKKSRINFEI